jgi:hypothetical protein
MMTCTSDKRAVRLETRKKTKCVAAFKARMHVARCATVANPKVEFGTAPLDFRASRRPSGAEAAPWFATFVSTRSQICNAVLSVFFY